MRKTILAALILQGLAYGVCIQDTASTPAQPSLADIARASKKAKQQQDQPKTVIVADERVNRPAEMTEAPAPDVRREESPSRLPDLVLQGGSNIEDIVRTLELMQQQRGQAETEAALHRWYDKHDAMLLSALQATEGMKPAPSPNSAQGPEGLQNVATGLRIQAAFLRIIGEFPKLGFRPEWFRIQCNESNLAPCR
jgi:hypothetical protein